tara:strand:+ start:331 stop:819 length:489 start_codon:yes stop_codon:yes gene_type:complete
VPELKSFRGSPARESWRASPQGYHATASTARDGFYVGEPFARDELVGCVGEPDVEGFVRPIVRVDVFNEDCHPGVLVGGAMSAHEKQSSASAQTRINIVKPDIGCLLQHALGDVWANVRPDIVKPYRVLQVAVARPFVLFGWHFAHKVSRIWLRGYEGEELI